MYTPKKLNILQTGKNKEFPQRQIITHIREDKDKDVLKLEGKMTCCIEGNLIRLIAGFPGGKTAS